MIRAGLRRGGATGVLLPALLLAGMAVLLVTSSLGKRLVYDEYDNLAYGYRLLTRGPTPPSSGQRMPVLLLNALPCFHEGCRARALDTDEVGRLLVRLPTIGFTLLLGVVVWGFGRDLFGPGAATLALFLYVTNPSFLGHGKQVTTDVATAFFTTVAIWAWWRLVRDRGRPAHNLALATAGTTGALLAKYTSLLVLPAMLLLALIEALGARAAGEGRASLVKRLAQLALVGLLVLVLVNAVFLFQGTFTPASRGDWQSEGLAFLKRVPVPLFIPRVFALGLDLSARIQEQPGLGRGYNYVLGELNANGRWYAFPLMILLKTPLALFLLLILATVARKRPERLVPTDAAFLLVPAVVILGFYSFVAKPQLGIRYVLPVLPFLILAAGGGAAALRGKMGQIALLALVAWHGVSALSYHPHYISYFNELIGPRKNAWHFLADSNLDWEDHSRDVEQFRAENPGLPVAVNPPTPVAGLVLVGANELVGLHNPERYAWLRDNFEPVRHVGYSYLLFSVPEARLREIEARPPGEAKPTLPSLPERDRER